MRIESQELRPDGVWTVYSDGTAELLPYKVDEHGKTFVDLMPNEPLLPDERLHISLPKRRGDCIVSTIQ